MVHEVSRDGNGLSVSENVLKEFAIENMFCLILSKV